MYTFKKVIKFNGQYFEHGNKIVVTKEDGTVIVGRIIIGEHGSSITSDYLLVLDVSEKYHQKRAYVYPKNIINIQLAK